LRRRDVCIVPNTAQRFVEQMIRLYGRMKTAPDLGTALREYVRRWCGGR
jgi:hypothetical protein